jgi:4-amino-4-deoxy-L-arabinose transferase-like glycosyltransferase
LSQSKNHTAINSLEKKIEYITNRPILFLSVIAVVGLIIRLKYFPFEIPIILDASGYFWYAIDTKVLGHLPTADCGWRCTFPNNGWPALLSVFFSLINSNNFMDYMNFQRALTVSISILTIIPIYLLCCRFLDKRYALFGAALFAIDPRLIQNSLLGITEPFFILCVTTALFLFLSNNNKTIYASFAIAAISSLIRYEGFLMLIPFTIMFFVRFRRERKVIPRYLLALSIFALTLLPMTWERLETTGQDGVISHIASGPKYYQTMAHEKGDEFILSHFVYLGIINMAKFLVLVSLPTFIVFLPVGTFVVFRKIDYKKATIILTAIIMLLPAFYAYSRDYQEVRYLLVLSPIFCVLSMLAIKSVQSRFKIPNIMLITAICIILIVGLAFLEYKQSGYDLQREAAQIAQHVYGITKVVNYYPQGSYLDNARIAASQSFPVSRINLPVKIQTIYMEGYNTLEEYIEQNSDEGLTYLVIDKGDHRTFFLDDVFVNENQYPYLKKVFDSFDNGYKKYHVKIFKIDYDLFDSMKKDAH